MRCNLKRKLLLFQKPDKDHFSKRRQWLKSLWAATLISGLWGRLAVSPADGRFRHRCVQGRNLFNFQLRDLLLGLYTQFPFQKKKSNFLLINSELLTLQSTHRTLFYYYFNSYRSSGLNIKLSTPAFRPSPPRTVSSARIMRLRPVWQLRYSAWSPWQRAGRGLR